MEIIDYHNFCSCSGTVPEHLKSIKMVVNIYILYVRCVLIRKWIYLTISCNRLWLGVDNE